ncbi:hypothetical protein KBZ21_41810, partial [Streptomyces sp. A73]|nr:hypothetical protein [Streptomyces sp. A73]
PKAESRQVAVATMSRELKLLAKEFQLVVVVLCQLNRASEQRTVDNLIELRTLAPDIPWMPVLQGWTLQHYLDCLAMYTDAG